MEEDYVIVVKETPDKEVFYLSRGFLGPITWTKYISKARHFDPKPNKVGSLDFEALRQNLRAYENYPLGEDIYSVARIKLDHCLYL